MNITSEQVRQAILRKPELKEVFGSGDYGTPTSDLVLLELYITQAELLKFPLNNIK